MPDMEAMREDARAESVPVVCSECEYKERGRLSAWECPKCDNYTRCPECHYCEECKAETEPMSDLGRLLFGLGTAMMRQSQ